MTHASLKFPLHFSRFVASVRLCGCLLFTVKKVVAYYVVASVFTPFVLLLMSYSLYCIAYLFKDLHCPPSMFTCLGVLAY